MKKSKVIQTREHKDSVIVSLSCGHSQKFTASRWGRHYRVENLQRSTIDCPQCSGFRSNR